MPDKKPWSVFKKCANGSLVYVLQSKLVSSPMLAVQKAIKKMYKDSNGKTKEFCDLYAQCQDRKSRGLPPFKYVNCHVKKVKASDEAKTLKNKPISDFYYVGRAKRAETDHRLARTMKKVSQATRGCSGRGRRMSKRQMHRKAKSSKGKSSKAKSSKGKSSKAKSKSN